MDVDDDAGSVVCERYLLRSTLVLAKNRFVYYTRAMAKRTCSGKLYWPTRWDRVGGIDGIYNFRLAAL